MSFSVGQRVATLGTVYVPNADGYRKVHAGVVLGGGISEDWARTPYVLLATRYGKCTVNPSQLVSVQVDSSKGSR